jgi:hypothetical protein
MERQNDHYLVNSAIEFGVTVFLVFESIFQGQLSFVIKYNMNELRNCRHILRVNYSIYG